MKRHIFALLLAGCAAALAVACDDAGGAGQGDDTADGQTGDGVGPDIPPLPAGTWLSILSAAGEVGVLAAASDDAGHSWVLLDLRDNGLLKFDALPDLENPELYGYRN